MATFQEMNEQQFLDICRYGSEQEIINAINKVSNVNLQNDLGITALMIAAGRGNLEIVNALLNAGANINATRQDGFTALMIAVEEKNLEVVNFLLQKVAAVDCEVKINGGSSYCDTVLMLAVKSNNLEIVNALLKAGADVNAKNTASFKGILLPHYGKTALIYAAEKSTPEIINALINVGADVNAIDNKHYKAIDYARNNEKLKGSNVLKRLEELSK